MAKRLGTIGQELDIAFRQGATFGPYQLTIKDASKNPLDLTNYSFSGRIKEHYNASSILCNVEFNIVDAVNGKVSITIPPSSTSLVKGNPDDIESGVWDAEMINDDGQVEPIFYGKVYSYSNV